MGFWNNELTRMQNDLSFMESQLEVAQKTVLNPSIRRTARDLAADRVIYLSNQIAKLRLSLERGKPLNEPVTSGFMKSDYLHQLNGIFEQTRGLTWL